MADGLTYAGFKACLDVEDRVGSMLRLLWPESRWPFRDRRWSEGFQSSTLRTNRDPWLESPYPLDPCPRINELIIPTGAARYAKALLLFDHPTMLEVAYSVWNWTGNSQQTGSPEELEDIDFSGIWGAQQNYRDLVATYGGKTLTWSMTALTPQLLTGGLWLVPLVDRRYFLHRNLRSIEFADGVDMSWGTLFDELEAISGLPISPPSSFNPSYLVPDRETFESQGVGIGHILDAAALSFGLRAVPAEKGTELKLMSAAESRDLIEANYINQPSDNVPKHRQLGGFYPRAPKPKELKLVSPILRNYYVCEGHEVTTSAIAESSVDNERIVIFTTCYAQYLESFLSGASSSQLYDLAEKLRIDLADWAKWSHNGTFAAVANYTLTGHDDYWFIGFRAGRIVNSQVRALPHDFYPRIQLSQAPAFFRHLDDGIICKLIDDITACDDETLQLGSGNARPMLPTNTGLLEERTKSDGSEITIKIWNASYEALIFDEEGLPQLVQCKRVNCLPVIDVEYCPPEV